MKKQKPGKPEKSARKRKPFIEVHEPPEWASTIGPTPCFKCGKKSKPGWYTKRYADGKPTMICVQCVGSSTVNEVVE